MHLRNDNVVIERDQEEVGRVPLHHLAGLVLRNSAMISPGLMRACSERGVSICWFDHQGQYAGSIRGTTQGNVLLRLAQYGSYQDEEKRLSLARAFVQGKVANARETLMRRARELGQDERTRLTQARKLLEGYIAKAGGSLSLDEVRGHEGAAARLYFEQFSLIVGAQEFSFESRTRRPPRDPVNALLSFVYTLVTTECVAACEGVGLDPQVGFLHEVRPGRPACALDLVEEFRTSMADRLVFALINRKQVTPKDFDHRPGGAVLLNERGRKIVLKAFHERKQQEVDHPLLSQKVSLGLIPHIQARILARTLRQDIPSYVPFLYR